MKKPSQSAAEERPRRSFDDRPPGAPMWVKAGAVVVGVVLLVALAVALLSGGDHGPGRHLGESAPGTVVAAGAAWM
ncbi:hypothetical protein [Agrococcus sp. DT81.2]|uniref:hypothetical protein n=1 Tax=Agrococcus sp. DT81.2 TaxID=3393414 RepID=UPI003CE469E5